MLLSEAISLGHTLIGEDRRCFYDAELNCGCAIGSAAAAVGDAGKEDIGLHWCVTRWPWTAEPALRYPLLAKTMKGQPADFLSVAFNISLLHHGGMPRLEIAALIAKIEPPEPGLAASSHSPAPATVEVSA